jgi:hypothetical protein
VSKIRIIKSLASIKMAVVIIVLLGTITAVGTFVEAHFNDSVAAVKMVYGSFWMYGTMGLLAVCLIAVMIDRWPWQRKHVGFISAHIGIITLMTGALITRYYGVDGMLFLEPGMGSSYVQTNDTVLSLYSSMDGVKWTKMGQNEVDFFSNRPTEAKPFSVELPNGTVKVVEYVPYAFRDDKVVESDREAAGAGVRFQLQNPRVSQTEWLVQSSPQAEVVKNLGPAQVMLVGKSPMRAEGRNAIVLIPKKGKDGKIDPKLSDELDYEVHTARDPKNIKRGHVKAGDQFETGWMGLVFRLLKYVPKAEERVVFKPNEQSTPVTSPAVRLIFDKKDYWLGLNSTIRLFSDQAVYVLAYENTRLALDFEIKLKEFRIGRNPGTLKAASYESSVDVPGKGDVTISMNEPLKHHGYTLYQSSFQEDENHRPTLSILSVNRDPGRWIKYLGSLLIVLGTIHLFVFKGRKKKKA